MKTILGFFLLLTWLHSNLGAILPRFDLKDLLLICYLKALVSRGWVLPLVLCVQLLPPRYNPISAQMFTNPVILTESNNLFLLWVLTQGLEHKVPDCAQ